MGQAKQQHSGEEIMKKRIMQFLKEEEGATAVEYGVLIALIIAVCIVVITTLGNKINNAFNDVASRINK